MDTFNLIKNPWIPVRYLNGEQRLVSLETVFQEATKIGDLSCQPHERISLMRLLICITQRVFDPPETDEDWDGYAESMGADIPQYLNQSEIYPHFNLLGDGPRFLQVKVSHDIKGTPITKLIPSKATGNNNTLFDQAGNDDSPSVMPHSELALALLTFENFYPPYGQGHKGNGPCVDKNMLHTLCSGFCLKDTIRLNCITKSIVEKMYPCGLGKPIWEIDTKNKDNLSIVTTSYLGRLVPRHRDLWVNDSRTHYYLSKKCIEYEKFEVIRESTATVVVNAKSEKTLLSARLGKAIWRDLDSIVVTQISEDNEFKAPFTIQSHYSDWQDDAAIWVGALIADKGKIVEVVESSITVPLKMFEESGRSIYQQGISFTEDYSKKLYGAMKQYGAQLKVEKIPIEIARKHFWNALDQQVDLLLDIVRKPETRRDNFGDTDDPWTLAVRSAALKAYEDTCPRQTPRQLKAYSVGLRSLMNKSKKSKK